MIDEITKDDVLPYLDHIIMEFQLNDLRKVSMDVGANFLVAIGCMNTVEFLGGIESELLGKKEGKAGDRFKAGVRLLSGEYVNPPICDEDMMYELRNGLTHQYLASIRKMYTRHILIENDWQTEQAIFRDGNEFTLNVAQLVRDLGMAWGKLRTELGGDSAKLARLANLLNSLPILQ